MLRVSLARDFVDVMDFRVGDADEVLETIIVRCAP